MASLFDMDIQKLKGIGEKRALLYRKLGVPTVGDLLRFYPRGYEDWSQCIPLSDMTPGKTVVVKGRVLHKPTEHRIRGGMVLYKTIVTDDVHDLHLTFFNNKYIPSLLKEGQTYLFRGKAAGTMLKKEMASPDFMPESSNPAIVPIYPQTQGLTSRMIATAMRETLTLLPQTMNDPLPAELRREHQLCHLSYALEQIHFPKSNEDLALAKYRLVFEEFLILQIGLIRIKSGRRAENKHKIKNEFPDSFANTLSFQLTGAQKRAISDAISDMAGDTPMNRLIQGDVGSGKTAVAAALSWSVIQAGRQAAMMAPTEILAAQHFHSLSPLLGRAGIRTALLTGSVTAARKRVIYEGIANGEIQFVIGTHALISDAVEFQNLGMVITDEQHRFGVEQRSALAKKGTAPHLLVMSATPIPRTLALMVYGDLDVSVLDELPPGRRPVETYLIDSKKRRRAFGYIQKHLDDGRQGYLICPLVEENDSELAGVNEYAELVKHHFPRAKVGILHGKLKPAQKDTVMRAFADGELGLLVATTVVEVGVDVPNAVIMLIENAERYGLSQLHQLRGRIGRGQHQSTCILLSDSGSEETLARLKILCSTTDGFRIADEDLKLRGPGDFFGKRQHGLPQLKIADMMSDMEILHQAQECAKKIVAAGLMETDSYKGLRAEIRLLFKKSGDIYN